MKTEYFIIIILVLIIIILLLNKNKQKTKRHIISNYSPEKIIQEMEEKIQKENTKSNKRIITTIHKTNGTKEEMINQLQQADLPQEVINNIINNKKLNGIHTKTTNSKTVHYMNGKKVKETNNTTTQTLTPFTNCPNCGAEINKQNPDKCDYCNTVLSNYIQKQE